MPCASCARDPVVAQSLIPDHWQSRDVAVIVAVVLAPRFANGNAVMKLSELRALVVYGHRFSIRGRRIVEFALVQFGRANEDPPLRGLRLVQLDLPGRSH